MEPNELVALALIRQLAATGEARRRRIAAKLRQTEMASGLHVRPGTLSRWESGERIPSAVAALAWLSALQLIAGATSGDSNVA